MKYKALLLFGAPGSGKGTQGKILGKIPGFYHCACGDVFRALDYKSELGQRFIEYSSRGELVPDDLTIDLWSQQIRAATHSHRFNPENDLIVLDGVPRNVAQARIMENHLDVLHVFHLSCPHREMIVDRLKRRALRDNRLDDANEDVIRHRLETYELETKPVLDYYGESHTTLVDAIRLPFRVTRDVLDKIDSCVGNFQPTVADQAASA